MLWQNNGDDFSLEVGVSNKYGAKRTWSDLCGRWFASRAEARRGEELALLERGGVVPDLLFQQKFVLNEKPRITITIDFVYTDENGETIYEDTKGVLTRDFRTKLAWLEQSKGIKVLLTT